MASRIASDACEIYEFNQLYGFLKSIAEPDFFRLPSELLTGSRSLLTYPNQSI